MGLGTDGGLTVMLAWDGWTGSWGRAAEACRPEEHGAWLSAKAVPAMRPTLAIALSRSATSGYWVSVSCGVGWGSAWPACMLELSSGVILAALVVPGPVVHDPACKLAQHQACRSRGTI